MKWGVLLILVLLALTPFGYAQALTPFGYAQDAVSATQSAPPAAVPVPVPPPAPQATPAPAQDAEKPAAAAPQTEKPVLPIPVVTNDNSYVLGPTDTITLTVLKEPTLSSNLLVRPDGMITVPLLGDVRASGLTPLQLANDITTRLKKYIQDPNVSVILTQSNSKKVYLLGEVSKIGPVDITPGMTLLEAIASAGGITQYANAKKMYILRVEDGKHTKVPVHYKEALKGYSSMNLPLMPGDTIVVP